MYSIHINDQVAWVTGGSRGIGRASALALAKAGCDIALSYHSRHDEAEAVKNEIEGLGRRVILCPFDVKDAFAAENIAAKIEQELGIISILVNAAGIARDGLFMMFDENEWNDVWHTNLLGYARTIKAAVPGMMIKRFGRIINISSTLSQKSGRGQASYGATKAAIEAMTRSIAVEHASRGITANCIAPGIVETDMTHSIIKIAREEILDRQLIKRFAKPEEIAAWVVFMASEFGSYMTGQTLAIDGGFKMP